MKKLSISIILMLSLFIIPLSAEACGMGEGKMQGGMMIDMDCPMMKGMQGMSGGMKGSNMSGNKTQVAEANQPTQEKTAGAVTI